MGCNCKHVEMILGIVIIVFALWGDSFVSMAATKWILVIAGALLLLHAFKCKNCGACDVDSMPKKASGKKKK